MKFKRELLEILSSNVKANNVCLILGARRVGKTELINEYLKSQTDYLKINADDITDVSLLEERSVSNYQRLLTGKNLLVIDEAQNIPEIGQKLKLIVDSIQNIKVIATGSSALNLSYSAGEPLVGRKTTLHLYPLSYREIAGKIDFKTIKSTLNDRLIYGSYPDILTLDSNDERAQYLGELVGSYLLKDILSYEGIRKPEKIKDLLKLLAYQVGGEVDYTELGNNLGISKNTVDKYIDLLVQTYVIIKVRGYSRNLRKEVTKNPKVYFTDNGLLNAVINNFTPAENRRDLGPLWENYCVMERMKRLNYDRIIFDYYFWRTYDQQEIDWLESYNDSITAFEMKYRKSSNAPKGFINNYPDSRFYNMTKDNYFEYIE